MIKLTLIVAAAGWGGLWFLNQHSEAERMAMVISAGTSTGEAAHVVMEFGRSAMTSYTAAELRKGE